MNPPQFRRGSGIATAGPNGQVEFSREFQRWVEDMTVITTRLQATVEEQAARIEALENP